MFIRSIAIRNILKLSCLSLFFITLTAAPARSQYLIEGRRRVVQQRIKDPADNAAPLPDPGNLTDYRNHVNESLVFSIVGSLTGNVWGTDIYTDDSTLATAAVHAGIVQPGEQANVKVTILPGQASYTGLTRNGVASNVYADWDGSYRVERLQANAKVAAPGRLTGINVLPPNGGVTQLRGQNGQTFFFDVVGSTAGTVWGDEVYTDDSSVAAAAVHDDLLDEGERGIIAVTICPGQDSYNGAERNGVTSQQYAAWGGSYRIRLANVLDFPSDAPAMPDLQTLRNKPGKVLYVALTGSATGSVWGNDIYTDDSSLAAAAVHAKVLRDGEFGFVRITIAPGQATYNSSTQNGVTSQPYGPWQGSFKIERMKEGFVPGVLYQYKPETGRTLDLNDGIDRFHAR